MKIFQMLKRGTCVLLMITPLFLAGCSKEDHEVEPDLNNTLINDIFEATELRLTIDTIYEPDDSYPGVDYIRIDYTVKNLTNETVPARGLEVRWQVKAADGTMYGEMDKGILAFAPLNAGASVQSAVTIKLGTPHNHADRSTLAYRLQKPR